MADMKLRENPDLEETDPIEFEGLHKFCARGLRCHKIVVDYANTQIKCTNPRKKEEERKDHIGVPDPHPCGMVVQVTTPNWSTASYNTNAALRATAISETTKNGTVKLTSHLNATINRHNCTMLE
jgi:hypothetical protein